MMARPDLMPLPEPKGELEQMFDIFDRDSDGHITHAEFKRALGRVENVIILTIACSAHLLIPHLTNSSVKGK